MDRDQNLIHLTEKQALDDEKTKAAKIDASV